MKTFSLTMNGIQSIVKTWIYHLLKALRIAVRDRYVIFEMVIDYAYGSYEMTANNLLWTAGHSMHWYIHSYSAHILRYNIITMTDIAGILCIYTLSPIAFAIRTQSHRALLLMA